MAEKKKSGPRHSGVPGRRLSTGGTKSFHFVVTTEFHAAVVKAAAQRGISMTDFTVDALGGVLEANDSHAPPMAQVLAEKKKSGPPHSGRPRGRPFKGRTKNFHFLVTTEFHAAVVKAAAQRGIPMTDFIIDALGPVLKAESASLLERVA